MSDRHSVTVSIPFFGPPMTLSPLPRQVAAGGLHRLENGLLYISRGIGMESGVAPPIRFWCPPEVTLLVLGPVEEGQEAPVLSAGLHPRH